MKNDLRTAGRITITVFLLGGLSLSVESAASAADATGVIDKATGFFHTARVDGRWWLVDPEGRVFYAVGTDHCRFQGHWCEALGYHPYEKNMQALYGSEEAWAEVTAARLLAWGFNTLAVGHTPALRRPAFAHSEDLHLGTAFASKDAITPRTFWTGFPNVFSPQWEEHCDQTARARCAPQKDNPRLLGYFLDNELEWYGKNGKPWGLFDDTWKLPADHAAKRAWTRRLRDELKDPADFETHWGVRVADFDALAAHTSPAPPRTDRAREIAHRWVREIADRYFRICAEAIRRHDPNHLILGCRFAGQAPDIWDIAGKYCDVVSFNTYPNIDIERGVPAYVIDRYRDWHRRCGRPMMVTEWSFPALDSGLPCTHGAGMRVDTQAQRAKCFTQFQTLMFRLPFMVGSNYFMWVDEPAQGISRAFPENSNYGLVSEQDQPYAPLCEAARLLNPRAVELHRAGEPDAATRPEAGLWEGDRWFVPWLKTLPQQTVPMPNAPMKIDLGDLTAEGPIAGRAWRLSSRDAALGYLYPVLQQGRETPVWVATNEARIAAVRKGDRVTAVDMELVGGIDPVPGTAQRPPSRFRTAWRFWLPARPAGGEGAADRVDWIAAQCLWVENADAGAWWLESIFHYLLPTVGGRTDRDEPLNLDAVPQYHRRGAAWVDHAASLGVACWFPADPDFRVRYWKDSDGNCHPDLFRTVQRELRPGERIDVNGPLAFFFTLRDLTREGFVARSWTLEREVMLPP